MAPAGCDAPRCLFERLFTFPWRSRRKTPAKGLSRLGTVLAPLAETEAADTWPAPSPRAHCATDLWGTTTCAAKKRTRHTQDSSDGPLVCPRLDGSRGGGVDRSSRGPVP